MLFVGLFIILPMYLTNTWYTGHLPFNTNKLYDRYGKRFVPKLILDDRGNFDLEKYKAYSVTLSLIIFNLCSRCMEQ